MLSRIRLGIGWLWQKLNSSLVLGLGGLLIMLIWRLGSSPGGLSSLEKSTVDSSNLKPILSDPIYLPYRLLQDLFLHINHSIFFGRLTAAIFGLIIAAGFYLLLKGWIGASIAMLSTILLVTTPYFILSARSATPAIMLFTPVLVLAAYSAASRRLGDRWPIALLLFATGSCMYVPGTVWLIVLAAGLNFSKLKNLADKAELDKRLYAAAGLGLMLLLAPLVIGLIAHPAHIRQWLLIPGSFGSLASIAKSWLWALLAFVFKTRAHQDLIIDRLPLLNAAQVGLLFFGAFVMWSRLRREFLTIIGLTLLVSLLSGLNNNFSVLALVLPLLMIMIGMGLRYLFIEWRHVFPLNPIAKGFAIGLMSVLVLTHVIYGVRYSLIAWPVTVATSHTYVLK